MICFLAFTPHSPLLIETIGKENSVRLESTLQAMKRLREELYANRPSTLVTISSHRSAHPQAFSINFHEEYAIDLGEFGDQTVYPRLHSDAELITTIQQSAQSYQLPLTLDSDPRLDYGVSVPLLLLTFGFPQRALVPIAYSARSPKEHVQFGRALKDACLSSHKRIAIIASGDLSHSLSSDAPAGFHASGQQFDDLVKESIKDLSLSKLLSANPALIETASESAYRSLLILFGVLERMHVRPEILSYEHPFGVGELVAQFHPVTV